MNKLCIIASLILALPYILFPAADQLIPKAPELPPAPAQPAYVLGSDDLKNEEYAYYMELTENINPQMYEYLKRAEKVWGQRCFKKTNCSYKELQNPYIQIKNPTYTSKGYPFFIIPHDLRTIKPGYKMPTHFQEAFHRWQTIPSPSYTRASGSTLSIEQRTAVLALLKKLAPKIHTEILMEDTTGQDHIYPSEDFLFSNISSQFLPQFFVPKEFFIHHRNVQLFMIGHELGHYALLHFKESCDDTITAPYKAYDSKLLQAAISRLEEYEADFFALSLSEEIYADAGIQSLEETIDPIKEVKNGIITPSNPLVQASKEVVNVFEKTSTYKKNILTETHPSNTNRIQQLKILKNCFSEKKLVRIDWDTIIRQYRDE